MTKLLGGFKADAAPDVHRYYLCDNDRLLICSDGLTDMLDAETIARLLGTADNSARVCQQLVEQALEAGGRDNVTVVVATYRCPEPKVVSEL